VAQRMLSTSQETDQDADAVVEQATPSTSGENEKGNLKITYTNQWCSKGSGRPRIKLTASVFRVVEKTYVQWYNDKLSQTCFFNVDFQK